MRIEIVDSLNRPMFPSGSSKLQAYAMTILTQIGAALNDVDNRVSIAGHTDAVPYTAGPRVTRTGNCRASGPTPRGVR